MANVRNGLLTNVDGSDVWEAERILGKRTKGGILEYRVKWKDYSVKESTWEPATNILDPSLLNEFINRSGSRGRKSIQNGASTGAKSEEEVVEKAPLTPSTPSKRPLRSPSPRPSTPAKSPTRSRPSTPAKSSTPSAPPTSSKTSSPKSRKKGGSAIRSTAAAREALANGITGPSAPKQAKKDSEMATPDTSSATSRALHALAAACAANKQDSGVPLPEGIQYMAPIERVLGPTVELGDPSNITKGRLDIFLTMNGKRLRFAQGFDTDFFRDTE